MNAIPTIVKPNTLDDLVTLLKAKTNWGSVQLKQFVMEYNLSVSNTDLSTFEQRVVSAVCADIVKYVDSTSNPTYGLPTILELTNQFIRTNMMSVYTVLHLPEF